MHSACSQRMKDSRRLTGNKLEFCGPLLNAERGRRLADDAGRAELVDVEDRILAALENAYLRRFLDDSDHAAACALFEAFAWLLCCGRLESRRRGSGGHDVAFIDNVGLLARLLLRLFRRRCGGFRRDVAFLLRLVGRFRVWRLLLRRRRPLRRLAIDRRTVDDANRVRRGYI